VAQNKPDYLLFVVQGHTFSTAKEFESQPLHFFAVKFQVD